MLCSCSVLHTWISCTTVTSNALGLSNPTRYLTMWYYKLKDVLVEYVQCECVQIYIVAEIECLYGEDKKQLLRLSMETILRIENIRYKRADSSSISFLDHYGLPEQTNQRKACTWQQQYRSLNCSSHISANQSFLYKLITSHCICTIPEPECR